MSYLCRATASPAIQNSRNKICRAVSGMSCTVMLGQRRRRWENISPALGYHLVFALDRLQMSPGDIIVP